MACAVMMAVVLAGCSAPGPSISQDAAAVAQSTQLPATAAAAPRGSETESTTGALQANSQELAEVSALLGWGLTEGQSARLHVTTMADLIVLREEHIARCMEQHGFEYRALNSRHRVGLNEDPDAKWDTVEFTERYGFGQSTLIFNKEQVAPDGIGYDAAWRGQAPLREGDTNSDYFWSLDEATQVAYEEALNGPDIGRLGGCEGEAEEAFPDRATTLRFTLAEALDETDARVQASAEFDQLARSVDDCMNVGGFTFTGVDDMLARVRAGVESLQGQVDLSDLEPDEDGTISFDTDSGVMDPRLTDDGVEVGSNEWLSRVIEVQQFELQLAGEFDSCIGMAAWLDAYDAIAMPYRQEMLATNLAVIADLGGVDLTD